MENISHNHTTYHQPQSAAMAARRKDINDLDLAIGQLSQRINASNYELMLLIREFDERAGWLKWSFPDCVSWLKWRCDLSHNAARDKLRIAHALKDLPHMSDEFSRGTLSYSKVRALTRVATAETESELIALAHRMTAAHVEQHCRQRKNATRESTQCAKSAYETRSLHSWRNEQRGVMTFTLEVPLEEGALFEKAVDKAAVSLSGDSLASNAGDLSQSDWCAVQADAAIAIAKAYLCGADECGADESSDCQYDPESAPVGPGRQSSSSADHYQVMIHVDEDALTQRFSDTGGAKGKSELPLETVRRLCCDGSIVPVVENTDGEPLSVGRKVRTVSTAIRRALWARDKGCAFPGCSHTRFVDAHHIKHWADGGETSTENMLLLCSQHHRLVHEGGYSILVGHDGVNYFKRPDGKAVPKCGYHRDDSEDEGVYEDMTSRPDMASGNSAECGVGEPLTEYFTHNHRTIWRKYLLSTAERVDKSLMV